MAKALIGDDVLVLPGVYKEDVAVKVGVRLLSADPPGIDLNDRSWLIHTKTEGRALGYVGSGATVEQSLVSHGCRIHGHVQRSVLSPGVVIEEGAIVRDSIVKPNASV